MAENKKKKKDKKKKEPKMNIFAEIVKLKKQVFWLNKNVNDILGKNGDDGAPIVKYAFIRTNGNPVHGLKLAKEGDSGYDIYPNIPISNDEWDAAIAKNKRLAKTKESFTIQDGNVGTITVQPGATLVIPTNIALELPLNIECQARPRSGLNSDGILIGWGTVDEGYRGEVGISVHNSTKEPIEVTNDKAIAQLVFVRKTIVKVELAESVSEDTERGSNGFGSTSVDTSKPEE